MAATAFISMFPEVWLSESDASLVARVRAGDEAAARRFYERHADRVYRTAWRILRERDLAEIATQDAFVRALDALPQLRDGTTVGAWLCAIATRVAFDRLRSRRRELRRLVSLDHLGTQAASPSPSPPQSPDPLLGDHLREAIAGLSDKLQVVLVMYELEGHTHAEIAAALKIEVATSKSRLSQARALLRVALAVYAQPESDHA